MKRVLPDFLREYARRAAAMAMVAAGACLMAGCGTVQVPVALEPPAYYHPANIYVYSTTLPASLRRVALLPVTTSGEVAAASQEAGVEALEPVLVSELEKTKRFEVVTVSHEQLRQWTGQSSWRADEALPHDFFDKLQKATGSDAVMFGQITRYQPYPPLVVGWKLNLAAKLAPDNAQPQILWSVDDVLDGGDPHMAHAARTYYSQHIQTEQTTGDPNTILRSPSLFGQFTLGVLFGTLPERAKD
jgi:hypothetical protein